MTRQFVCGASGSCPVNGQTTFTSDFLLNSFVNFIIVNNINETQLDPSPDFSHSYVTGTLVRSNPWVTGDKLVVDYSPCKCGAI